MRNTFAVFVCAGLWIWIRSGVVVAALNSHTKSSLTRAFHKEKTGSAIAKVVNLRGIASGSINDQKRHLAIADASACSESFSSNDLFSGAYTVCPDLCGPGRNFSVGIAASADLSTQLCLLPCDDDPFDCDGFNDIGNIDPVFACSFCTNGITAGGGLRNCYFNEKGLWQCFNGNFPLSWVPAPESAILFTCLTLPESEPTSDNCNCFIYLGDPMSSEYDPDKFCQSCSIVSTPLDGDTGFYWDCSNLLEGSCVGADEFGCISSNATSPTTPVSNSSTTTPPPPTPLPPVTPSPTELLPVPTPADSQSSPPVEPTDPPTMPVSAAETSPTRAPQTNPTAVTMVQEKFSDVSLSFHGVIKMSGSATETFERLTKEWYESFFVDGPGRAFARNMQTTIKVIEQNVSLSEDESLYINTITYNHTIEYAAESNNENANYYISLPFKDFNANTEYGEILKSELDAFQDLQSPLPTPQFETVTDAVGEENDSTGSAIDQTVSDSGGDEIDGEENAIGVIVGASIGGAMLLAIAVFVGIRVNKRRDDTGEGQSPPSAAGVIVFDGQGEALAPRTYAAQAVLLASDNPTILQKDSSEVQTTSAGSLDPSPPQQVIDTPVPEPTAVSTPSDGYDVQFKDQARSVARERLAQLDP